LKSRYNLSFYENQVLTRRHGGEADYGKSDPEDETYLRSKIMKAYPG